MSFIIDKQTLKDLAIFSSNKEKSVFEIFNSTRTRGGAGMLREMFSTPLDNGVLIERRSSVIDGFRKDGTGFPFTPSSLDAAEAYLAEADERTRLANLRLDSMRLVRKSAEYQRIQSGISGIITILRTWKTYTEKLRGTEWGKAFMLSFDMDDSILENQEIINVMKEKEGRRISRKQLCTLDEILRYGNRDKIRKMLEFLYLCDVYSSVAAVAREKGFNKASVSGESDLLDIKGLRHPFISDPVTNDVRIGSDRNIVFLTGANMAGKSTFMKSLGIAVFLAHLGFPVPATEMTFSIRAGLYTTINLPDDINRGYSHFYAEVRRLKRVAQTVGTYRNMLIIFDELFRGTNVRDAFDATVAVAEAFSQIKESIFMISTHIIEAGDELKKSCDNVEFIYLPTVMDEQGTPRYTYKIREGITGDRHGMMIIRREGILDILDR